MRTSSSELVRAPGSRGQGAAVGADAATLCELLRTRAVRDGGEPCYEFLRGDAVTSLSFRELDLQARAVASCLMEHSARGARVVLLYPPGAELMVAFFGCLFAGVTAVPIHPASGHGRDRNARWLVDVAADAGAVLVMAPESSFALRDPSCAVSASFKTVPWLSHEEACSAPPLDPRAAKPHEVALLHYDTRAGATHRGVTISQSRVLRNVRSIHAALELSVSDAVVSWLPVRRDAGLAGLGSYPLYSGAPLLRISPAGFLATPARWLHVMAAHKADVTVAPSFAYAWCLNKVKPEDCQGLDLSRLRLVLTTGTSGERDRLRDFCVRFGQYGFRPRSFLRCDGLCDAPTVVDCDSPARSHDEELIRVGSRQLDPKEIERTAGCAHERSRLGAAAAFRLDRSGRSMVVVVQEVTNTLAADLPAVASAIVDAVRRTHALLLDSVVLVGPGGIPRSLSGEPRRLVCRDLFLARELPIAFLEHTFSRLHDI